jgi:hypothetical protein
MACPMPRAAPVTRADLPSRLKFTCGVLSPMSSDEVATFIFCRMEIPPSAAAEIASIRRRDISGIVVLMLVCRVFL